jgi:hypothetical protein
MFRHLPGQRLVTAGHQHHRTSLPSGLVDQIEHVGVVRQHCHIELPRLHEAVFQVAPPPQQPEGQAEDQQGLPLQRGQQRFERQIRANQRSIQVDTQGMSDRRTCRIERHGGSIFGDS